MRRYLMRGLSLFDSRNRKIAITSGQSIYDAESRRIGSIHGDKLFDSQGRTMMTVRGLDIYDADDKMVANQSQAKESIEGIAEGMMRSALWYCFVR